MEALRTCGFCNNATAPKNAPSPYLQMSPCILRIDRSHRKPATTRPVSRDCGHVHAKLPLAQEDAHLTTVHEEHLPPQLPACPAHGTTSRTPVAGGRRARARTPAPPVVSPMQVPIVHVCSSERKRKRTMRKEDDAQAPPR